MSVPPLTRSWWCGGAVDGDDGSLSRCSSSTMVDLSHSPAATSTKMGDSFGLRRRRPLFIVVYVIMSAVLLYCITTNSSCCFAPFEFNDDGCIKVTAEYIIHHTYQSHTSRTILYTMILQRCRVDLSLCIDHWSLIDDEASVRTLSVAVIYNNDDVEGTLFGSRIQLCIHLFCSPLYGSTQINIITARLYQCHACCIPFARNSFALCFF